MALSYYGSPYHGTPYHGSLYYTEIGVSVLLPGSGVLGGNTGYGRNRGNQKRRKVPRQVPREIEKEIIAREDAEILDLILALIDMGVFEV